MHCAEDDIEELFHEDEIDDIVPVKRVTKVKLRPLGIVRNIETPDDVVKENLSVLKCNDSKRRAQDCYYRNHNHLSPLVREKNRVPVKQRLGYLPNGTSTSAVAPKLRLRRLGRTTANNTILNRSRRISRNIAQLRLDRIRQSNLATLELQSLPKKVKLKRPTSISKVANYQVEVPNVDRVMQIQRSKIALKRFKLVLDPEIQSQLRELRENYAGTPISPSVVTPSATKITTNARFSNLI